MSPQITKSRGTPSKFVPYTFPLLLFPWKPDALSFAQIISKVATMVSSFYSQVCLNVAQCWANLRCSHMKKKMTLNTFGYDCSHLFVNFSFFELLGKFYCFIMKRKHAPILILATEPTSTLANDHFDDLYGFIWFYMLWIYQCAIV